MIEPAVWCLESLDLEGRLVRVPLHSFPFRIGRLPGLDLTLISDRVSKLQAQIDSVGGSLRLRDLGSRNGTFADGERIVRDFELVEGVILHFADMEFQVVCFQGEAMRMMMDSTAPLSVGLPPSMLRVRRKIRQMMDEENINVIYQPIVTLDGRQTLAYEALSRGCLDGLPTSPLALLDLASDVGQAVALSRMMNLIGVGQFEDGEKLFLNVHPDELEGAGFVNHLEGLLSRAEGFELVVEVPESAITDPGQLRRLQQRLNVYDIGLAFDDFGAGRSRLLELIDSPPDYLKFDRAMITELGSDGAKRRLVEALLQITKEMGVTTIAEGVETAVDARTCQAVGFDFAQGYFYSPRQANE